MSFFKVNHITQPPALAQHIRGISEEPTGAAGGVKAQGWGRPLSLSSSIVWGYVQGLLALLLVTRTLLGAPGIPTRSKDATNPWVWKFTVRSLILLECFIGGHHPMSVQRRDYPFLFKSPWDPQTLWVATVRKQRLVIPSLAIVRFRFHDYSTC